MPRQASLQNRFASALSSVPYASRLVMAGLLTRLPGSLADRGPEPDPHPRDFEIVPVVHFAQTHDTIAALR